MKSWQRDLALFTLASPILAGRAAIRAVRRVRLLQQATQPAITCRTCGSEISLVGLWQCACKFTYQGHLLRVCPLCGAFPRMVRCYNCGATEKISV